MLEFLQNPNLIRFCGITASLAALVGVVAAALVYRGKLGQRYSLFNHFISELGEIGVSRLAWVFNLGLMVCGLLLVPCSIGLGLLLPGLWSKLGLVAGCVAGVALALVGVYPMNRLTPHTRVAMTYFRFGLGMVALFTLAIFLQPEEPPVLPRLLGLVGAPAILAYAFFLIYSRITFRRSDNPLAPLQGPRPPFWMLTFAEWAIFLTTIPWFLGIALGL
jgi:hypothetical membrane protein